MRQLLQLNKISTAVKSVLKDNYVLSETAENPVGIMLRSFAMHEYTLPDTVVCVGRAGAGVNNIPVDRYADEGVVVFNAPGANANAVKNSSSRRCCFAADVSFPRSAGLSRSRTVKRP